MEQTIKNPKLAPTNEILSAFLSNLVGDNVQELKSDICGYVRQNFNLDLSRHDVQIVENDSQTVHLALPYYSIVEELRAYYAQMKRQAREDFMREIGLSPEVKQTAKKDSNEQSSVEKNVTLTIGDGDTGERQAKPHTHN